MLLEIDYIQFANRLQIKVETGKRFIFDPIRKKFLVLTPEEFIRQLLICYLTEEKNYNHNRLSIEKKLLVNGRQRRFDLLAYDQAMNPFLLIECKASEISLNQDTFDQVARYNMPLHVPYLMVTNGRHTYCCQMDYEANDYQFIAQIPDYPNEVV